MFLLPLKVKEKVSTLNNIDFVSIVSMKFWQFVKSDVRKNGCSLNRETTVYSINSNSIKKFEKYVHYDPIFLGSGRKWVKKLRDFIFFTKMFVYDFSLHKFRTKELYYELWIELITFLIWRQKAQQSKIYFLNKNSRDSLRFSLKHILK